MRRGGIGAVLAVLVVLAIIGTGFAAYGRGKTAGQNAAASDRTAFGQAGGTTVAGSFGGRGAGGAGGSPQAGGVGSPNGSATTGGATAAVFGKVTQVAGGTLTLQQQPSTTTTTVMTTATTTVTLFAPCALGDLAMGDTIALQGDKTSDTAFAAKTIFVLNGQQGRGADTTTGTAAAGSPTGGGRNQGAGGASGSAPAGGTGGGAGGRGAGGLFPGLNGPTGRITQMSGGMLTVQGFDGTTTTVTTTASTTVRKQATGAVGDIKVGDTISVQGDPSGPARTITDLGPLS